MKKELPILLFAVTFASQCYAAELQRRASITGSRGDRGKCTIEVEVDGAAEVFISGDQGSIRTLAGQTAFWRRFECSDPLPRNPGDFRFRGIDGRGRQTLMRDPASNRGTAVIRIEDRQGGREGYTFDLEWRGALGGGGGGGRPGGGGFPGGGGGGRMQAARAIEICNSAAADRIRSMGYRDVNLADTRLDDNPGRGDWVIGRASGRRRGDEDRFTFSCSVDFSTGRVRSVDVRRR